MVTDVVLVSVVLDSVAVVVVVNVKVVEAYGVRTSMN